MRYIFSCFASLFLVLCVATANAAEPARNLAVAPPGGKRVALVIGNAAYPGAAALRNPVNDATDIATRLRKLGFDVTLKTDAQLRQMLRALTEFGDRVRDGDEVLFFYAGHGMQVRGKNYLIPVDAEIRNESSVSSEAVDVDQLLDKLAPARLSMVILDACRNNPFERRFRGGGQGLAQINAPAGTLIAYATAPGKVAADGKGRNGLYTSELLSAMDIPGIKIEDVFKRVRYNVVNKSGEAQIPWESSSLTGDFYFRKQGDGAMPVNTTPVPSGMPATEMATPADTGFAVELEFWRTAKESDDPSQIQAYLDRYPNGEFAALARLRLESRQQAAVAALPLIDALPAAAFSASSIWNGQDTSHGPANARYSSTDRHSNWSADSNDRNQWLQVDLQRISIISAIGTKGRFYVCFFGCPQWVSAYFLAYSLDGLSWQFVAENNSPKLFAGNNDYLTEVKHTLDAPIQARFLRFHPQQWHNHVTMRVEAYGLPQDQ